MHMPDFAAVVCEVFGRIASDCLKKLDQNCILSIGLKFAFLSSVHKSSAPFTMQEILISVFKGTKVPKLLTQY